MNDDVRDDPDAGEGDPSAVRSDAPRAAEHDADGDASGLGPLLEFAEGEALEAHDRQHPGPGGEPECPRCGTAMIRSVERHPAPREDDSPFRVRLVCGAEDCRAWTAYRW